MNALQPWLISLKHYWLMSLFRSSPANLPFSPASLVLTLIAYLAVGVGFLGDQRGVFEIVWQVIIEVTLLFALSALALKITGHRERLLQTVSALIGVSLVISFLSLLLLTTMPNSNDPENIDPVVLQINLLLVFWNLSVISLIFKRSFEVSTVVAAVLAFNYFLVYEFLMLNLFT